MSPQNEGGPARSERDRAEELGSHTIVAGSSQRASRRSPCAICGNPKWCWTARDRTAVWCTRRSEGAARRRDGSIIATRDGSAFLHRMTDRATGSAPVRTVTIRIHTRSELERFARLAVEQESEAARLPTVLPALSEHLGVSVLALRRLRTGWNAGAWSWPMTDGVGRVVGIRYRGVARRGSGSSRWCEPASMLGLIGAAPSNGPILVCEGESDAASCLDLGIEAIAVPGSGQAADVLREAALGRDLVVVVDSDEPGHMGGHRLASECFAGARSVRVLEAPRATKDLREAVQQGMTPSEFRTAIELAPAWTPLRPRIHTFEGHCTALDARERFHE